MNYGYIQFPAAERLLCQRSAALPSCEGPDSSGKPLQVNGTRRAAGFTASVIGELFAFLGALS